MARSIQPPKSIADWGGLRAYLNSTADKHNGLKYRDLLIRINPKRKHSVPKVVIAEDFGVSTRTLYKWLAIYKQEATLSDLGPEKMVLEPAPRQGQDS